MPRFKRRIRTRLERERKRAKLTQTALARLAQIDQSTVSKLENLKMPRPSEEVLASLAWALNQRGRKVDVSALQPSRQLLLVRGLLVQPRKGANTASKSAE